ncbi:MAG: hypothetical protein AAF609_11395 [Cyanobacteria bacterium P01_C01_bin.120]
MARVEKSSFSKHHRIGWRRQFAGLLFLYGILAPMLSSCREEAIAAPRSVAVDQSWQLSLGNRVEGFRVVAGLGDVTMHLSGAQVRAPFSGQVELSADGPDCIFFSSPEVPAYLFRFCGVSRPQAGNVEAGDFLGRAQYLHFATMRRQPEGTWSIVEPSTNVLERSLQRF